MRRFLTAVILATIPAAAIAEPIIVPSAGSVPETAERLKASVENAGARVFCVVDFGGGIRSIGEDIGDMQLVIFGDPRIGVQALSADPMAALDLPGKVLVYGTPEDTGGFGDGVRSAGRDVGGVEHPRRRTGAAGDGADPRNHHNGGRKVAVSASLHAVMPGRGAGRGVSGA